MESQLANIFQEDMQIRRVSKELSVFTNNDEYKTMMDWRLSYIRKQQLIFHVTLKDKFFRKHKIGDKFKSNIHFKVVYPSNYPYTYPKIYFVSENMNQMYTLNTRDYFSYYCPEWTTKHTLAEIIFHFPHFLAKIQNQANLHLIGAYHRNQFIQMEPLYTQTSCQFYPVQILAGQSLQSAFLIVNRFDFILLQPSPVQNYLRLIDVFPLQSIKNVLRSKRTDKRIVLIIKWGEAEGGFEFVAEDHENIIESIISKKKISPSIQEPVIKPKKQATNDVSLQRQQISEKSVKPKNFNQNYLQQLNESIVIYESLLQKEFNQKNIDNLIQLYKQAIQVCSQVNSQSYVTYLNKMQELLSRQEVQALLNSNIVQPKVQHFESIFTNVEIEKPTIVIQNFDLL